MKRRKFLKAVVASQVFGYPLISSLKAFSETPENIHGLSKALHSDPEEEKFWDIVRKQYLIRNGLYMNNGTYGPMPRLVLDATIDQLTNTAEYFDNPGVNIGNIKKSIAEFIRCKPSEIAITRNTTNGMSMVANGLVMNAGDEILTTNHEHPGGLCCWKLKEKRCGAVVKQVTLPMPPENESDLLNLLNDNITQKTKVISISHVTFSTGLVFPVKKIAELAHDKGINLVVDGAHPPGMLDFDISSLNCDYYASSSHKWLCAPHGTGLLYVREEMQDRLWTTIASARWNNMKIGANRLDDFGTRNMSVIAGLGKAVEFQQTIGRDLIEKRIRKLITHFKEGLVQIPKVRMLTSMKPELSGGVASFQIEGSTHKDIAGYLWKKKKMRVRQVPEFNAIRISTHIYNSYDDVDVTLDLLKKFVSEI